MDDDIKATQFGSFELIRMSDVTPKAVDWQWRNRTARGKLSLIGGDPNIGKSQTTIDLAAHARLSRGAEFPDGGVAPLGSTIFICSEDDRAYGKPPTFSTSDTTPLNVPRHDRR